MQSELETAKQEAEQAKAKFARLFASVASKTEKAKAQQRELEAAKQEAERAKAQATEFASLLATLNSELEKANAQRASETNAWGNQAFGVNEQPATISVGLDTLALASAHIKVGNALMSEGNLAEALKSYRDGLAVAGRLAQADPKNAQWQHTITLIYIKVGDVLMAQGDFAEALKTYRDALPVADRLAKSDPENAGWQRNLSLAYNKADSSDTDAQRDLAISQGQIAAVLAELGDASRALDLLQQARVTIARLVEQSPDNDQLSKDLTAFDDNIAKLEQASAPGLEAAQREQAVR